MGAGGYDPDGRLSSDFAEPYSEPYSERAVYVISVAADLAGVHPQTLRIYERKGLLSPKRTPGNSRRYSERDVERLRQIQRLTQEGVNLAGVRIIMEMQRRLDEMQRNLDARRQAVAEAAEERPPAGRPTRPHWGVLARLDDVRNIYELRAGPRSAPRAGPGARG
ncbi:MAG TPA: helix-turn-helix transcriptional regulator [Actinomycetota bacterium]|nr:helix-turn-helix transcriptional regulator [Actinomycetota bacterium]